MATPSWQASGQYYETCSCDFVYPCLPGGMPVRPIKGWCRFVMAFAVDRGAYGTVPLDGLGFILLGFTPEEMGKGNWSVGLIVDQTASAEHMRRSPGGARGSPSVFSLQRRRQTN